MTAEGARGGGRAPAPERGGAFGARIWATLGPLTPGESAEISVGGQGHSYSEGSAGGFNGGGAGGHGGGGYTKLELESTLEVLAGGGGGGGMDGHNGSLIVTGGRGGNGGEQGDVGSRGTQTLAAGATLKGGAGGAGGGAGGGGGEGGQVVGSSTCEGGATAGVSGGAGASLDGGGGVAEAGGGGGGGYLGGGQGGAGANDACADKAAYGGGGGGSSFVAPGHLQGGESAGGADGWLGIEYDDPVTASAGEYTTFGGQELDVSASLGVLAGSSGPEPGPLTASLVSPTAHGSLTLEPDGSFTYTPEPGFLGSDSFVYRAADAAGAYADATVALGVAGPPSATIASPSPVETYAVGEAVQATFTCSEGPGGPGLLSCDDSNGTTSANGGVGHLDTATVGHHTYTVTAVSKDGLTGNASFEYEVVPAPPPGEETPAPGEKSGSTPPGAPGAPENPDTGRPEIKFPTPAGSGSLQELLRTGRLGIRVRLGGAAKLVLSGRARLRHGAGRSAQPKLVKVLGSKSVSFATAGERTITLVLTQKGRRALWHLSAVSLVIIAEATDVAGETARKSRPLRLGA